MENPPQLDSILRLSPWDFDQSQDGWRGVEKKEGAEKAVAIILEYIRKNKERILNPAVGEKIIPLELMNFHIGQLLAGQGEVKYFQAVDYFSNSFIDNSECWNAYVSATIGFLQKDSEKIRNSILTIESSVQENKASGNIGIVKNFLKALEAGVNDYLTAYSMPRRQ